MSRKLDQLVAKYTAKLDTIAEAIRAELVKLEVNVGEVCDMNDGDDYTVLSVAIGTYNPPGYRGDNDGIDISLRFADSQKWDGTKDGCNFMLDITTFEGRSLGMCIPYNYSDAVWVPVKDEAAVAERFRIFDEAINPSVVAESVAKAWKEMNAKTSTYTTEGGGRDERLRTTD